MVKFMGFGILGSGSGDFLFERFYFGEILEVKYLTALFTIQSLCGFHIGAIFY
jgi:hypothetical protein